MSSQRLLGNALAAALLVLLAAPAMAEGDAGFKAPELTAANFDATLAAVYPCASSQYPPSSVPPSSHPQPTNA